MARRQIINAMICASIILLSSAIAGSEQQRQLTIFHAGSLSIPFERIIEGFRKENPGVSVHKEVAGSRECAKKISELHQPCDIFASADYQVIDSLLIPKYADWNLKFATNEMAIVFRKESRKAKKITKNNWFDILGDASVKFGRADPDADPDWDSLRLFLPCAISMKSSPPIYRNSPLGKNDN
jgi:molybdate/tungstate transport system substrate-binding protein